MTVGLNTNLNNFGYSQSFGNNALAYANPLGMPSFNSKGNNSNSLLSFSGNNPLQPITNNYEEDFMMPDYLKLPSNNTDKTQSAVQNTVHDTPSVNPYQAPAQSKTEQTAFTANPDNADSAADTKSNDNQSKLDNYLVGRDKSIVYTEDGNPYKTTDASKKVFTVLGLASPVAGKVPKLFKGAKFAELFKFKQLAIACPLVALAGFGIGALIDGYINSNRAKAADTPVMYRNNQGNSNPLQGKTVLT